MGGRVSEGKGFVVAIERIGSSILLVRGNEVLLDADLAALYGVTTKRFNEQVRCNAARFPEDFMFQLSVSEIDRLRSQLGEGLSFSVEGMAVAGDLWSYPNESCGPEQH